VLIYGLAHSSVYYVGPAPEFDESCGFLLTTSVCDELGETEKSEESCRHFALEVANVFKKSLGLGEPSLASTTEIFQRQCQRGIDGESALTQAEACSAPAATKS